jgi:hypothetical protein
MRTNGIAAVVAALMLCGCAGRDPQPVPTVQIHDSTSDCPMIRAEIEANNIKIKELADEQGWKTAQNVAAGIGGFFTLGIAWAGMDAKGAAAKDAAALEARQKYLTELAVERCKPQAAPPAQRRKQAS